VVEELRETPTFLDPSDIYSTATFSRVDGEEVRHSQYQGYGWINIRGIFGGMISSDDEEHGDYITLEDVSLGRGSTVTLIPDTAMKVASRISRMNLREGDSIWANCGRLNIMPFKGTSIHAILDGCLISKWPPVGPGVGDIQIGLPSAREGLVRALSSNLADYP
jgi:hypothetical protein